MIERSISASHTVRRLLRVVISEPERLPTLSTREQDLVLRLARRSRLLGRLAAALDASDLIDSLPATAADQLRSAIAIADSRARLARWELDRIAWAMRDDICSRLVALKGCAYLLLELPNAKGRVFADVDLMTEEDRLEEVEATLIAHGWRSATLTPYDQNYYRKWTHELPPLTHYEREIEVDLHHNVLPRTARLKPDSTKLMNSSRRHEGSRYSVLANEDIVLHAMTHLMFADDLNDKLRDLVDIADLIRHFAATDEAFWNRFEQRAPELNLQRPAYYSLRYLSRILIVDIPVTVLDASRRWAPPRFVVWIMDRLVPRALYPQHPDFKDRITVVARWLLYVRSHWIRMPPWLLVYHLGYKFTFARLRHRRTT